MLPHPSLQAVAGTTSLRVQRPPPRSSDVQLHPDDIRGPAEKFLYLLLFRVRVTRRRLKFFPEKDELKITIHLEKRHPAISRLILGYPGISSSSGCKAPSGPLAYSAIHYY